MKNLEGGVFLFTNQFEATDAQVIKNPLISLQSAGQKEQARTADGEP